MIDCNSAVRQLWNFIEHDLAGEDEALMDEHLAVCRRCCGEVEFAQELRAKLRAAATPTLPSDAGTRLSRFIDALDAAATEQGETTENGRR